MLQTVTMKRMQMSETRMWMQMSWLFNQPYSPLVIRTVKNESFTGKVSQFIDGDGNCLFRCLSWFVHKGDQSHHRDIRRKIVGHFRKRSNVFERLAAIDNMSLDDLCAKYETNGEFGDEYCLASFCDLYQMEVTVFSNINTQYHVTVFTPQARPASYMKISLHLSVSSDHYEVVLDSTQEFETAPTVQMFRAMFQQAMKEMAKMTTMVTPTTMKIMLQIIVQQLENDLFIVLIQMVPILLRFAPLFGEEIMMHN
ncbi:hypothetical protein BCR33DRAFT_132662 [Rhizoclosmatium globosum]|uniref:OTU domain-containing protein n=1 Tax=Rhizoclosmatium globosum TaxID=329046 RepID=A0A1Y2CHV8_9FUNG|nr:hypothetical protein BCR33DRAFT_132662 [Rhizoclosmatium globosum]|eukprot:ORY46630.1 hypothetical protein BCR33DRAFT_132662 [Rhizoclosmatium globosum]